MLFDALDKIDRFSDGLARAVSWLCLVMLILQAAAVLLRYVFHVGFISVQEAVVFCHALLFLLAAAAVLKSNRHVRVDVIHTKLGRHGRRLVDIVGLAFFVLPMAAAVAWFSYPYVVRAWATLETSRQPGGVPAIFLLKSAILVFAVTIVLQAVSLGIRLWKGTGAEDWQALSGTVDPGRDT